MPPLVIDVTHLLQPGHLQTIRLVDHDQRRRVGLGTLTLRHHFVGTPPLVLPAGDFLGRDGVAVLTRAAVGLIQRLDLTVCRLQARQLLPADVVQENVPQPATQRADLVREPTRRGDDHRRRIEDDATAPDILERDATTWRIPLVA